MENCWGIQRKYFKRNEESRKGEEKIFKVSTDDNVVTKSTESVNLCRSYVRKCEHINDIII